MSLPDDEQLKSYLKGFRPVAPESLHTKRRSGATRRVFLLAAGAAACFILALLWIPRHAKQTLPTSTSSGPADALQNAMLQASRPNVNARQSQISAPVLAKLAFDDREAFDAFLTDKLRTQLPRMEGERSALRVLAKE